MPEPIDYDKLTADFENSLVTTLRGHRPSEEYLEMWVPDEDPVKGMLNMIEAAEAAGRSEIVIRVKSSTLPASRHGELKSAVQRMGKVDIQVSANSVLVSVTEIGSR